jgi:hypothetical protein
MKCPCDTLFSNDESSKEDFDGKDARILINDVSPSKEKHHRKDAL